MALPLEVDILGQHPMLRLMYTNLSYIFCLDGSPNQSATEPLVQTLTEGLQSLAQHFPWIAGQVSGTRDAQGSFQVPKIIPFEETPPFQTACRPEFSIQAFRQANWSMRMLDPDVFAPRLIPLGQAPSPSDPAPVFLLRMTFITGGVVLTFAANHSAMDMTGQTMMIRLLSKACHGFGFTEDELRLGNREMDAHLGLFGGKDDDELKAEIACRLNRQSDDVTADLATSNPSSKDDSPLEPAKITWGYFQATPSALTSLKRKATESVPVSRFVSTDDALTALIWQAITRARFPHPETSRRSLLARAVDVRKAMGIAEDYPGMMQNMAFNNMNVGEILSHPLGALATQLREKLSTSELGDAMRVVMTLMTRRPHESPILKYLKPSVDVLITSWAKMNCYGDSFNLGLGRPENVLRPCLPPIGEGWVNLMPRSEERGILFGICLKESEMSMLRADEEFCKFVQCID
ncbi:unnamed protein product [Penicillium salamii]|uniref:Trichothecene 3-O-acetyltransferase-like N-terminal domain-containing protein n=1 Tax=Penicillium salamii TaxID=1612424 RepID=A0A9W4NYD0_9EURO|nr:unnamed protein product [Penicillium salamii]CAG8027878.1 unnamed protein product [Penicillium salamii]CAG8062871.1 unnamed protein product [Penicillium salamii]CAG8080198.1 unnamed protein product [Penicillium salamii]CAG8187321.1 unnamed protein product [Penicillium salamii]